ncbi:secretion protein HlyD family protein [Alcanivorax hongdengensis A-11-3]|uniref:Secretion protein HlyD family protein n=1 Tax=Alcanivorax hongdengensis A-11-3 TaxID=1177179 RepID=L0WCI3_9GAMM|nr:HlyD family secretion protein [Alcanivorax hongdengensis]EKF73435.1 secretion protein HlyD family protein [Alcanivorax hongdengensis A-11-3]
MNKESTLRFAITGVLVLAAALLAAALWRHYMYSPWTRDGRVRAQVVKVAPDVSGLVTEVAVQDNQAVKKGDLLFVIDPSRYRNAVDQARADLDAAEAAARAAGADIASAEAGTRRAAAELDMRQAESERRQRMQDAISREARANARSNAAVANAQLQAARASRQRATASQQQALATLEQARAALQLAELNLSRTRVRAAQDGYVTNLDIYPGDYVQAGAARLALIGSDSFWVYGYFEETKLPGVHVGDRVDIRLMNGVNAHGQVQSIARGIADRDNPTGADLLADVNPTFNWVRLAQRVPVRVRIDSDSLPAGTVLAAGMTATVVLR